jgi:hypothetical protein
VAETVLPKLIFAAAWLHEILFDVPAVQVAFWILLCIIDEDAVALVDGWLVPTSAVLGPVDDADAAETALPPFRFLLIDCMSQFLMYLLYRLRFEYLIGLLRMWR